MRKFLVKHLQGGYSIKMKNKYLNFPKTMPYGLSGMLLMGLTQPGMHYNLPLFILGCILTGITFFAFFYFIFKPLNREEVAEFYPDLLKEFDFFNPKKDKK